MPRKLEIRTRALRDLRALTLFIAEQNGDFTVALKFAERLLVRCEDLLQAPSMGSPYIPRPGIRKLNESSYKIFYRITSSKIVILRVWDGRQGHDPDL